MKHRYEFMFPEEIEDVLKERPIAFLPWGALEWHGYHLPIGQDALKASAICDMLAQRTGGIALPPVWIGHMTMKPHAGFKHTLEFAAQTLRSVFKEYIEQLEDEGFRVLVVLAGHYGAEHIRILKEVEEEHNSGNRKMRVWVLPEYEVVRDLGYSGDHAGKWETSIFWHLYPDYVDLSRFRKGVPLREQGIGGEDPSTNASRELGKTITDAIVERISERALKLLEEELGRR